MFNDKEQQIIVLLKAGFSTKEISVLTEQSSATIYTRKSVIRKKLATPEDGDFTAQLDAQFGTV
jgi:DNA-binding NarL/FixJ family response regulator